MLQHGKRPTIASRHGMVAAAHPLAAAAGARILGNGGTAFDLPFVVQGPWDDPLIFPDPESLIRRSPASAPLLDAVKDKRTRDTVCAARR